MSAACEIEFEDAPSKVVYAGQLLKGTVIVHLYKGADVRGIYLRLSDEAFSDFWTRVGSTHRRRSDTEKHLDEKIICLDGTREKSRPAAGTHRFPFEVQLNRSLPTSLEEEVANNLDDYTARVRYKASVYLNELCDGDPIHEEIFTLIKPLDLKMLPNLQEPFSQEYKKRFCYCCCFPCFKSDELKMVAQIPQKGYSPGHTINFQLDVQNKSSETVKSIKVKFVREVNLHSVNSETGYEYKRTRTTKLYGETLEQCSKDQKKVYNLSVRIPATPPTDEQSSKIIHVSYKILVIASVGSLCTVPPEMEIPIRIFACKFDPPKYEETFYIDDNVKGGFKPKYPVVTITTVPT